MKSKKRKLGVKWWKPLTSKLQWVTQILASEIMVPGRPWINHCHWKVFWNWKKKEEGGGECDSLCVFACTYSKRLVRKSKEKREEGRENVWRASYIHRPKKHRATSHYTRNKRNPAKTINPKPSSVTRLWLELCASTPHRHRFCNVTPPALFLSTTTLWQISTCQK